MKAMILAAGFGSRLGEITRTTPKCLVDIRGKTMIELVINQLIGVGVTSLVINIHYLAEKVREYFEKNNNFGLDVVFSYEPVLLGTGGGIKNVESHFLGDLPFFVHNADIYSEIDLSALLSRHHREDAVATLAVMERKTSKPLVFDSRDQLIGWESKENSKGEVLPNNSSPVRKAFSGIQVLSPKIFQYMRDSHGEFSSIGTFMKASRDGARIVGHDVGGAYWIDVGTPTKLEELRSRIAGK